MLSSRAAAFGQTGVIGGSLGEIATFIGVPRQGFKGISIVRLRLEKPLPASEGCVSVSLVRAGRRDPTEKHRIFLGGAQIKPTLTVLDQSLLIGQIFGKPNEFF